MYVIYIKLNCKWRCYDVTCLFGDSISPNIKHFIIDFDLDDVHNDTTCCVSLFTSISNSFVKCLIFGDIESPFVYAVFKTAIASSVDWNMYLCLMQSVLHTTFTKDQERKRFRRSRKFIWWFSKKSFREIRPVLRSWIANYWK